MKVPHIPGHIHIPVSVAVRLATDLISGNYAKALRDGVPLVLRALADAIARDGAVDHPAASPPKVPVSGPGDAGNGGADALYVPVADAPDPPPAGGGGS